MISFKTSPTGETLMAASGGPAPSREDQFHSKEEWSVLLDEMGKRASGHLLSFSDTEVNALWDELRAKRTHNG